MDKRGSSDDESRPALMDGTDESLSPFSPAVSVGTNIPFLPCLTLQPGGLQQSQFCTHHLTQPGPVREANAFLLDSPLAGAVLVFM